MMKLLIALCTLLMVAAGCSDSTNGDEPNDDDDPPDETTLSIDSTTTSIPEADLVLSADGASVRATVDDRFQSYNVEMVEVTGGNFWSPYDAADPQQARDPIDLESERLRNLARELGPAYVRVSGSWANSTYFDVDGSTGGTPPDGFGGVLTTALWDAVADFANAVDGKIVTSFASSEGVRDADGVWLPDQARALMEYSRDNDVTLAAAEFFNEPSLNIGTISDYTAEDFARDFEIFRAVVAETYPTMQIVGPGSVDDETPLLGTAPPIAAEDMLERVSPAFEAFSYHFYPKVSERCGSEEGPDVALTDEFLSRVEADRSFYESLRDTYEPGAPMWITETAQAACGGDRWASRFVDVFRYLDEMGRLASGDGDVVFHNTLAASDYGLIDEDGFEPRPNYWAALLWQRLMGQRSLELDVEIPAANLAVYAHCTSGATDRSVTYLVINLSQTDSRTIAIADGDADLYLLSTDDLQSEEITLNGRVLVAAEDGSVPDLVPDTLTGTVSIPATSVAFIVGDAAEKVCGR